MNLDKIHFYQVSAFTEKIFHGNPAMVYLLPSGWLNDELLKAIAAENFVPETAFVIDKKPGLSIRWFTPRGELCVSGHSTLAAAYVLFERNVFSSANCLLFDTPIGPISVTINGTLLTQSFIPQSYWPSENKNNFNYFCDQVVLEAFESETDYLVRLEDKKAVLSAQIDVSLLEKSSKRGLIITAQGKGEVDFYSRCFYPKFDLEEDPVTGSAYRLLVPFWSERLHKNQFKAVQGAIRKGALLCEANRTNILISGHCKQYAQGTLAF